MTDSDDKLLFEDFEKELESELEEAKLDLETELTLTLDSLTLELTDSLLLELADTLLTLDPELVLELENAEQHGQPVLFLPTFLSPHIHSQNHSHAWQTRKH